MSVVSKILRQADPDASRLFFWCPGCNTSHCVAVGDGPGVRWGWNGDVNKPTFTPSVLTWWNVTAGTDEEVREHWRRWTLDHAYVVPEREHRCHSFVADGVIDFLGDCTHALRGKHPIPDWPKPDWGGTVPAVARAAS